MSGLIDHYRFGVEAIAPEQPHQSRVALHLDATGQSDGTSYTTENSRHGHTLTWVGGAQITSEKFVLDGTGYIELFKSLLWTPGCKFTFEIPDIMFDSVSGENSVISQYNAATGGTGWQLLVEDGEWIVGWSTTGSTTNKVISTGVNASTGTPYPVAVCWDGDYVFILVNGVQIGELAFAENMANPPNALAKLRVGSRFSSGSASAFLSATFTELLFTKGECLYTRGVPHIAPAVGRIIDSTASTDPFFDDVLFQPDYDDALGRIRDFGPLDLPVNAFGNAAGSTSIEPYADANSIALDGSEDYCTIEDDPFLEIGSGDLTVEASVRLSSVAGNKTLLSKYFTTGNQRSFWMLWQDIATDVLTAVLSANGSSTSLINSAAHTPTVDVWEHWAYCRDGSDHRMFIDGTQSGATQTFSGALFNSNRPWVIGASNNFDNYMNGYISQLRVTKAARRTAAFTPPAALLPRN